MQLRILRKTSSPPLISHAALAVWIYAVAFHLCMIWGISSWQIYRSYLIGPEHDGHSVAQLTEVLTFVNGLCALLLFVSLAANLGHDGPGRRRLCLFDLLTIGFVVVLQASVHNLRIAVQVVS